jgi:hypothetical protein
MAKQIARLLKTDVMADIDIPAIAQFLQSQGRRGDTILAHINAKEAELLKMMGGAEERNPVTGLPEYFSIADDYAYGADPYTNKPNVSNTNYDLGQFDLPALDAGYPGDYSPGQMFAGGDVPYNVEIDSMGRNLPITVREPKPPVYGMEGIPVYSGKPSAPPSVYDYSGALIPTSNIPMFGADTIGRGSAVPVRTDMPVRTIVQQPKIEEKGMIGKGIDELSKSTGLSKEALARLGLAGIGTIQGIMASREASEQGRQARRDTEALARPYQQRGEALIQQAQAGELTAAGQQQLQALRARLAQGAEGRGGVGAAQAAAQVEAFRQNLLQNQFDYGQKISNIGDQLMLGAIRTGLEADRYAAGLSNTYFTNMASIAAGLPVSAPIPSRGE